MEEKKKKGKSQITKKQTLHYNEKEKQPLIFVLWPNITTKSWYSSIEHKQFYTTSSDKVTMDLIDQNDFIILPKHRQNMNVVQDTKYQTSPLQANMIAAYLSSTALGYSAQAMDKIYWEILS